MKAERNDSLATLVTKAWSILNGDGAGQSITNSSESGPNRGFRRRERHPDVVEIDLNNDVDSAFDHLDGAVVLLRDEAGSSRLDEFERGVREGDLNALEEIYESIAPTDSMTRATASVSVADLTYDGETVIESVGTESEESLNAGVAPFRGGNLDPDSFEVQEYVSQADDIEYEYRVVLVAPTRTDPERDANATVPDVNEGPAIEVLPAEAHVAAGLFAAGVLLGAAAAAGGGKASATADGIDITDVDTGAPVEDLIAARERLQA